MTTTSVARDKWRSFARRAVAAVDVAMRSSGSGLAGRPRERLLACVALGAVVGALAASWDKSRAVVSASNLGWMPDEVRRSGNPAVMLEYRRDVIAAALKEWRATVHATGYAADFDLEAGPLGAGAPLDGVPSASASTRLASRAVGVVDVAARLDPGGALALTPEPAMPTDVVVPPDLRELILRARSADRGEVMLGLANDVMMCNNPSTCWWDGGNILESFLEVTWRRLGVRNLVLAVLDDTTEAYMAKHWPDVHVFRPELDIPSTQDGTHPANRVSALKYQLLRQFIATGTGVLVTDLDLVYLSDPFQHLYRDADVEGQTDGFNEGWAHGSLSGIQDKSMGWGGGGLYAQVFTVNVGCMYVRPTARSARLMARVARKMATTKTWDQQAFNEEALLPAHGDTTSGLASVRIMDYLKFVNSKTFFKSSRGRFLPGASAAPESTPVMIHMNYHPDKHKRMLCLISRYHDGNVGACDAMPGGSEPGT